ncbi:uncharacterized protein LOC143259620 isoform X2 [Megalopta genalis]|uniref:uncharacterized protein LOC143259620 isoform X2 n=1 Tax=Megalopta genalis TaxID=115081 RepID=UPI003FD305C2
MSACDTHYELSVRLMRILGLWPYVSETTRRIQTTLVNIICSLLVIVQITPIVTGGIDTMVLLQSLSTIIMVLGSVVKFNAFLFLTSAVSADQITVNITRRIVGSDGKDDYKMQIRQMTDSVKNMWNTTHKDTLEILERRAILGKQQGAIYAIFIYPSAALMILFRIASYVSAVASTEVITFPLVTDYLVEEQTYLLYIVIHQSLSFFFIGTIYVATETLFIMWLQHTISMYELFSYFIQKATVARPSHVSKKLMDTYRKNCLASAVIYHTEAKVFMSFLKTELSFSYAVLLVFAVVSLSINLFRYTHLSDICRFMQDARHAGNVNGLILFHFRVGVHVLSQLHCTTSLGLHGQFNHAHIFHPVVRNAGFHAETIVNYNDKVQRAICVRLLWFL